MSTFCAQFFIDRNDRIATTACGPDETIASRESGRRVGPCGV